MKKMAKEGSHASFVSVGRSHSSTSTGSIGFVVNDHRQSSSPRPVSRARTVVLAESSTSLTPSSSYNTVRCSTPLILQKRRRSNWGRKSNPDLDDTSSDELTENLRDICKSQESLITCTTPVPHWHGFLPDGSTLEEVQQRSSNGPQDYFASDPPWEDHTSSDEQSESPYKTRSDTGQVKRGVRDASPTPKRCRSTPASPYRYGPSSPVLRGGLSWRGPSTYTTVYLQDSDGASGLLENYVDPDLDERGEPSASPVYEESPRSEKAWPYSVDSDTGLIDTHCHLDFLFRRTYFKGTFARFRSMHDTTFPACYEGCVAIFCNPATFGNSAYADHPNQCNSLSSQTKLSTLCGKCFGRHKWSPTVWENLLKEDGVWGAFGCHPHMALDYTEETDEHLINALQNPKVVALGEIGLDYSHKNFCNHAVQKTVFRRQLKLALQFRLPIVIHSRDATQDTLDILKEHGGCVLSPPPLGLPTMFEMIPKNYPVHRHCFTGSWAEAEQWLETFPGLCLGLTPLVSFSHTGGLREVAYRIPLERVLLETDAPYFLPKSEMCNLQHSHPGMVIHVATALSTIKGISVETVLRAVRDNTQRIYKI